MERMDLYTTVHKGLRAAMFEAALEVARTDFRDPAATEQTVAVLRRLSGFLDEHAEHEDRVIMPEIARLDPGLHVELEAEHTRVAGLGRELVLHLDRFACANAEERAALGKRLHLRMGRLVAEHLRHMEREESIANRVLWAHHTDAEIIELHERILAAIPPVRMVEWMEIILPAIDPGERATLEAGMELGESRKAS